MSGANNVKMQV